VRIVLQRVSRARVEVGGERLAAIGAGLVALVGIERGDDDEVAVAAADKVAGLRVFADERGRLDLNLRQAGGSVLVVPNFTLLASTARGRRPSFERAATPELAAQRLGSFVGRLRELGISVERGRFGAHMEVVLANDGPVTLVLDFGDAGGDRPA